MEPNNQTNVDPEKIAADSTEPPVTTVKPEPVPVVHVMHEQQKRHLPTLVGYILAAFLVAIAVVWFGRWLYQKTSHKTNQPTPAANTNKVPTQPTNPTSSSPSTNANSGSGSSTPTNSQLPNSGPGDVISIFIGASVVCGGLHYLHSLRRSSN